MKFLVELLFANNAGDRVFDRVVEFRNPITLLNSNSTTDLLPATLKIFGTLASVGDCLTQA